MIVCLHCLLSAFLLGLFAVYRSGYDHTHREQMAPVSLTISGSTADLNVLTQTFTIALPSDSLARQLLRFALLDEKIRFCTLLLLKFTENS